MLSEQAVSMINEETSLKIKEQPKMVNMPRQVEGTNLELYEPGENDTTQEQGNIFVWKDIWKKLEVSCDSPQTKDASMQPQTPSNGSDIGSISTGTFCFEYVVAQQGK